MTDDVLDELFSIRGKTAVITGGTRGIGLMMAEAYVRAGVKVYVSSRKADVCAEVAERLSEIGECIGIPADLSTEAECRRLADEIASREDRLHVLINNAGATWGAPLAEHDDAAWDRVLNINVKGPYHLTRFLRPLLDAAATDDDPAACHQRRLDRRHPGPDDGDLLVLDGQGRGAPADASPGASPRAEDHRQRGRAGSVRVEDDGGDAAPRSATRSRRARPMKRIGKPADMAGIAVYLAGPGRHLPHRRRDPRRRRHQPPASRTPWPQNRTASLQCRPDRGVRGPSGSSRTSRGSPGRTR